MIHEFIQQEEQKKTIKKSINKKLKTKIIGFQLQKNTDRKNVMDSDGGRSGIFRSFSFFWFRRFGSWILLFFFCFIFIFFIFFLLAFLDVERVTGGGHFGGHFRFESFDRQKSIGILRILDLLFFFVVIYFILFFFWLGSFSINDSTTFAWSFPNEMRFRHFVLCRFFFIIWFRVAGEFFFVGCWRRNLKKKEHQVSRYRVFFFLVVIQWNDDAWCCVWFDKIWCHSSKVDDFGLISGVVPSFVWFLMEINDFYWVFYWVFTEFYCVLPCFTGFYWVLLGVHDWNTFFLGWTVFLPSFTGFYLILIEMNDDLLGFGFYLVLMIIIRFFLVLPCFYRVS